MGLSVTMDGAGVSVGSRNLSAKNAGAFELGGDPHLVVHAFLVACPWSP